MKRLSNPSHGSRRGASLVIVLVGVTAMFSVSYALWSVGLSLEREQSAAERRTVALYAAEAGMSAAFLDFNRDPAAAQGGALGSPEEPLEFGGARYWVERAEPVSGTVVLTASGIDGRGGAQVELVLRRQIDPLSIWAAFGDEGLTMDSNAFIDSYDSSLGSYDSQDIHGSGSNKYASSSGNAGSNKNIGLRSNTKIHGSATPGPEGVVTILGKAIVTGTTTPAEIPVELPPLDIPEFPSSGNWKVAGTGSVIGPGNLAYGDLELNSSAKLTVVGPAIVVVDSLELKSNSSIEVDATAGPVTFFVKKDFIMNSNTRLATTDLDPTQLSVQLQTNNIVDPGTKVELDELSMDSNAKLYGTLYAPNAFVEIKSNFELFGALIAKRVHLDSNSKIHFDEALMQSSEDGDFAFQVASWSVRSFRP